MALSGLQGLINAIDVPARQSLIVGLIDDREALPNAIAMNSLGVNSARLIGPAVGGWIVAVIGEGSCFLLNAVSYLAVVVALFKVRRSVSGLWNGRDSTASTKVGYMRPERLRFARSY